MNRDFVEMLNALSAEGVEFLIVGAYAVAGHGLPRATGDIDLWGRPSRDNATKVWNALGRFGAPRSCLTPESFTERDIVYQIGLPPNQIVILTDIDGVTFEEAWRDRVSCPVESGSFFMISRHHLLANKRATGRSQDLADVARLEEGA
ncbi:MAG: hypothetical protein KGR24_03060 [Planctomycetes bacterium]|nr:hypothetical protein [Planctomycetota bacterium]